VTRLVLPGGTDIAALALFAVASLPAKYPRKPESGFEALEDAHAMMLFRTGADGAYLLHAYVDEPIPAELLKFCVQEEKREGTLVVTDGRIGFGGTEACRQDYPSNPNIRSDALIVPGTYRVVAFMTEYPDEPYDSEVAALKGGFGRGERLVLKIPGLLFGLGIAGTLLAVIKGNLWVAFGIGFGAFLLYWHLRRLPAYQRLERRWREGKLQLDMQYPSIVVAMTSA